MRVLLATLDSVHTLRGGVEAYVHHLAKALMAEGHEVRVLARRPSRIGSLDGIDYRWANLPRRESSHRYRLLFTPFFDRAVHAEAEWAEVVHSQNADGAGALGVRPVVATVHTTPLDEWDSSRLGGWREALYQRPIEKMRERAWRRFVAGAAHLWTAPDHVASSLRALGARSVEMMPNPIERVERVPRDEARAKLGWGSEQVVLYLGRLASVKRVERLVEAMRGFSDARLVIAGEGPERARLETLAKGTRTTFLGVVDADAKTLLYNAADAFCLPSEHEGQPLALLEAMSVGLPVVATRAEWVPQDLRALGLWGDDLPALLRAALARGRGEGAPVLDHRAAAKRMTQVYEEVAGR